MLTALGPDALNYFDALSVHPYGDQIPFSGTCPSCSAGILTPREQVEAIMAMIGGKQVWLTEYGVSSTDAASYQQQAEWIKDLLDTWQRYADPEDPLYDAEFAQQLGPIFLYTARDTAGSTDPGATLGVWTSVGGEKVYTYTDPGTGETVTKSVSQMLADWITAHPMPTNPGIPILSPIAALVQALVAGVQGFVNAVVTAITNFLGGLSGLAAVTTSATPLALRVASVASADAGAAGTEEATAADGKGAEAASKEAATEKTATETATEETATEGVATEGVATEETAAEETAAEETVAPAQPAVEETVTETETETTVPAKATETAAATEPAKTTEVTGSTETSTGATTPGSSAETGKPDETGKSDEAGKASEAGKTGEAGKSGASEGQSKSGKDADHEDGSGRHAHGKDGGGSVEIKARPIPVTAGVTAGAEGAEGASESTGGATS
jgi:hypothetical protein